MAGPRNWVPLKGEGSGRKQDKGQLFCFEISFWQLSSISLKNERKKIRPEVCIGIYFFVKTEVNVKSRTSSNCEVRIGNRVLTRFGNREYICSEVRPDEVVPTAHYEFFIFHRFIKGKWFVHFYFGRKRNTCENSGIFEERLRSRNKNLRNN